MAAEADAREVLKCSVCLDFFRNPAIIPCGHSFCKDCITRLWDQDVCRCPQCKETFSNKPAVTDWLQVKELSENLLKMRTKAEDEDDEDAEAPEVSCDSCTSRRTKAVRSCLTCVSSYCSDHLEKHNELHGWRKHLLTEATDLQSKTCSQHGKLIDVFCRTDQKCVCLLCAINEHKNHDTISASEERADRQRKLLETREKFLQNIQDREKDFEELKQAEESVNCSSQMAVTESERIFSEVVCTIQKTRVRVKELITERQRAELSRIEGLQEKVQQKISEMRMKVSELDQFKTTEDHIHFLQNYPSDCEESMSEEFEALSSISENPKAFFRSAELLVSKMQEHLLDVTKETEIKIKSEEVVPLKADAPVSLFAAFGKIDEQWECEACLVENEGTSSHCVSCHGPKTKMKSKSPSAPVFKFCFGSSTAEFKERLDSGLNAQIEQIKDKASPADFTFEPSTNQASAFPFSTLASNGGFNFGSMSSFGLKLDAEWVKNKETETVKTSHGDEPMSSSTTLSFGDLLKSSQGSAQGDQKDVFHFGESVTEFNFSFQHVLPKSTSVKASGSDHVEEACKHEDDNTLDYEPVVPLPDLVEISTGEDNEQVVFSHRAKLYRYDKETQQWKERGVGELKILQNSESKRARLVMRREQVLKLCANHWITPNMKLEPMKATEKAYTWSALDFAEGDSSAETLAARFKLQETADAFKKSFEEAVATSFIAAEREEKSTQEQIDVEIVFERKPKAEQAELAARLMLPHTFFCYRNEPGYISNEDDDDEDFEVAVKSLKGKLYPDAVGGCDAGAATETQNHEAEENDGDDDDEAVNYVELPSVEENEEEILFNEWTKLFLWDRDNNQWKSCGAGDIKILFHPVRKRYRVFMCQERDNKLCANHCITRTTHPKPLNTNANALTWMAADCSDGDGVIQQFAAKFKTLALADSFKKTLTDCQCRMSEFMQPSKE